MRLIDADALIDDLMERYCKECDKRKGIKKGKWRIIYEIGEAPCRACDVDDVKAELEEAPTSDVPDREVGEWTYDDESNTGIYAICSACGESVYQAGEWRYCPMCGAKMEEESNEVG